MKIPLTTEWRQQEEKRQSAQKWADTVKAVREYKNAHKKENTHGQYS